MMMGWYDHVQIGPIGQNNDRQKRNADGVGSNEDDDVSDDDNDDDENDDEIETNNDDCKNSDYDNSHDDDYITTAIKVVPMKKKKY